VDNWVLISPKSLSSEMSRRWRFEMPDSQPGQDKLARKSRPVIVRQCLIKIVILVFSSYRDFFTEDPWLMIAAE
jgi:hypothetical protein